MDSLEQSRRFSDVVNYIDVKRTEMCESVGLFETLKDESLPKRQRMLFAPYMLFFSVGSPDIKTLMMRIEKPQEELSLAERKINAFINEDNFHYNFYLRDLERLGYGLDRFGSISAVVRHVFAEEGIPTRRLVYGIGSYIDQESDPLIGLAITEIIEAGLFDLFTTVYQHIIKADADETYADFDYFGDTHVMLEQNHTVTSWFAPGHPEDEEVADQAVSPETFAKIVEMVDDLMGRFAEMYRAFDEIVRSNRDIRPAKFTVEGSPPIDRVTHGHA